MGRPLINSEHFSTAREGKIYSTKPCVAGTANNEALTGL
jgi:hypothetical protein